MHNGGGYKLTVDVNASAVWLNMDLGEWPGESDALYAAAHVANIACGGHAGDADSIRHALESCRRFDTAVGAHPSYPDRPDFGRVVQKMPPAVLADSLSAQMQLLQRLAQEQGLTIGYLKAHGALYHQANQDPETAQLLLQAATPVLTADPVVIGAPRGVLREMVAQRGWRFAVEGFADRGRQRSADGNWQLVPRTQPGAVLDAVDEVAQMVQQLLSEGEINTLCLHGDNPSAPVLAPRVRTMLDGHATGR